MKYLVILFLTLATLMTGWFVSNRATRRLENLAATNPTPSPVLPTPDPCQSILTTPNIACKVHLSFNPETTNQGSSQLTQEFVGKLLEEAGYGQNKVYFYLEADTLQAIITTLPGEEENVGKRLFEKYPNYISDFHSLTAPTEFSE